MASLDYIFSLSRVQDYGIGGHRAFLPFQSHTRGVESIAPSQGAIFRDLTFAEFSSLLFSHSSHPHRSIHRPRSLQSHLLSYRSLSSHLALLLPTATMGASSVASDDSNNDVSNCLFLQHKKP
jgi:hypothetical protein